MVRGAEEPIRLTARRGRHVLWANAVRSGADLVVVVGGGTKPHVGCVALAQPRPSTADPTRVSATTSLLAIPPHKEGELATRLARALAIATNAVVVVSAGVHEDDLGDDGIAAYDDLLSELEGRLIKSLGDGDG